MAQAADSSSYYVPHGTQWPIIGSIGLTTAVVGFSNYLNGNDIGMTFDHHLHDVWMVWSGDR